MNGIVKTFSILGMAAAMGKKVLDGKRSKHHIQRGKALKQAGELATKKYKAKVTEDVLVQVYLQINDVLGDSANDIKVDIIEGLSFINCGLVELHAHAKKKHKPFIADVIEKAVWVQKLYDTKLNMWDVHNAGFDRYEAWISKRAIEKPKGVPTKTMRIGPQQGMPLNDMIGTMRNMNPTRIRTPFEEMQAQIFPGRFQEGSLNDISPT